MSSISPKQYYQSGLYASQVATYFNKRELLQLMEADDIEQVQEVYRNCTQDLNIKSLDFNSKLAEAYSIVKASGVEMPPLPGTSIEFFDWLELFHREVLAKLEDGSEHELSFLYGYDLGYMYTHAEQLRFVTEMEYELPMQLSYSKQTQHIVLEMTATLNRLEVTTRSLIANPDMAVLSDHWPTISTILDSIHALDFMNVEHMVLYRQEKALAEIVQRLDDAGMAIYDGLSD